MPQFARDQEVDTRRPAPLHHDPVDQGAGDDADIAPGRGRAQIGACRTHPPTAADIHLHRPETFVLTLVHIRAARIAGLAAGIHESAVERIGRHAAPDRDRTIGSP